VGRPDAKDEHAERPGDKAAAGEVDFGGLLRACRKRGALSQERLAERSGLCVRTIRAWRRERLAARRAGRSSWTPAFGESALGACHRWIRRRSWVGACGPWASTLARSPPGWRKARPWTAAGWPAGVCWWLWTLITSLARLAVLGRVRLANVDMPDRGSGGGAACQDRRRPPLFCRSFFLVGTTDPL